MLSPPSSLWSSHGWSQLWAQTDSDNRTHSEPHPSPVSSDPGTAARRCAFGRDSTTLVESELSAKIFIPMCHPQKPSRNISHLLLTKYQVINMYLPYVVCRDSTCYSITVNVSSFLSKVGWFFIKFACFKSSFFPFSHSTFDTADYWPACCPGRETEVRFQAILSLGLPFLYLCFNWCCSSHFLIIWDMFEDVWQSKTPHKQILGPYTLSKYILPSSKATTNQRKKPSRQKWFMENSSHFQRFSSNKRCSQFYSNSHFESQVNVCLIFLPLLLDTESWPARMPKQTKFPP